MPFVIRHQPRNSAPFRPRLLCAASGLTPPRAREALGYGRPLEAVVAGEKADHPAEVVAERERRRRLDRVASAQQMATQEVGSQPESCRAASSSAQSTVKCCRVTGTGAAVLSPYAVGTPVVVPRKLTQPRFSAQASPANSDVSAL